MSKRRSSEVHLGSRGALELTRKGGPGAACYCYRDTAIGTLLSGHCYPDIACPDRSGEYLGRRKVRFGLKPVVPRTFGDLRLGRSRIRLHVNVSKRNSSDGSTRDRVICDTLAGVLLPVVCLLFDPIVFQSPSSGSSGHPGAFQQFAVLAYSGIAYQVTILSVWLALGRRLRYFGPLFGGSFSVGAVGALLLGIALLPLSIIGMASNLIGALGLIPFFTTFVYARNVHLSLRKDLHSANGPGRTAMATCGVGVALALPAICYSFIPPFTCNQIVYQILGLPD